MPGSVGQFFLRNWLLKLAAVFFALMLDVAVDAQPPLTEPFALHLPLPPPPARAPRQAGPPGPPESRAGVESGTPQPTPVASVPGPVYRTVAPDTQALGVARITPREVRSVGEVAALAQRVFAGVPVATAASGFTGWEVVSERVQVSVGGPATRVERLTRDSLRVVAHLVRPAGPGGYARLSVQAPNGIAARAIPDSVALKRKGGRRG